MVGDFARNRRLAASAANWCSSKIQRRPQKCWRAPRNAGYRCARSNYWRLHARPQATSRPEAARRSNDDHRGRRRVSAYQVQPERRGCLIMAASGSKAPGAPEEETELTPDMIEAGALALSAYDDAFESAEEAAVRIFRAMNRLAISAPGDSEAG